ncbi:MAG TPA: MFS transporter [Polyangiaceae bacterium]|nr:MFS transporter [Polyangiaceae bacterium]
MKSLERPAFHVLIAICFCHLINDMLQSLLVASYPTLKAEFHLTFAQIGLVTLAYQLTASLLQPLVGLYADRRPAPFSLAGGTLFTLAGLVVIATAHTYGVMVAGACVLGMGSSVFHPESSRVARMASGGRPGLAQSLFQVGGVAGGALGPVAAAIIVLRWGRRGIGGFSLVALVSTCVLFGVGLWYRRHGLEDRRGTADTTRPSGVSAARVRGAVAVLMALVFSKFVYMAGITSYYTFYLMHRFGVSLGSAQMHLFAFLAAGAAGTLAGGPLGDRFGRKQVIWFSILGVLPFTLALPYVDLPWTRALSVVIGFVLASAFPAIVVYGQELIPGRVGLVAGLFFGLSFGAAGLGAALMGRLADATSIEQVYRLCAVLPALGLLAALLPDVRSPSRGRSTPGPTLSLDEL